MIKIYHAKGTRGLRVMWLCEELNIDYEIQNVDFSKEFRFSEQWLKINPLGKLPSLRDGDILLFESCAMIQYILDKYGGGKLQPSPSTTSYAYFLQWLWFSEATFARPIGEIVNHRREFPDEQEIPEVVQEMQSRIYKCLDALNEALEGKEFILGKDFTAADISLGYSLLIAQNRIDKEFPEKVDKYWGNISSRRAFITARSREQYNN
tara:strand:+ start:1451 stop:2074 length:624 start_codon:yes stop_codon:yes gene_type:complete